MFHFESDEAKSNVDDDVSVYNIKSNSNFGYARSGAMVRWY